VIGLFVTIPAQCKASARVDISVEMSGPHDFTVRFTTFVARSKSVHRIPRPTFSDDRETPLWRAQDGEACRNDLPDGESGNIFALGLDGQSESFVQIEPRHHQMIATN
jgi:hypothetical protein